MIKVLNFPFCNFHSLVRYFNTRNLNYEIYDSSLSLKIEDILFIPGVGTFGLGMEYIDKKSLKKPIIDHALNGGKIIGICLGMQLFLSSSDESPKIKGLDLIEGSCELLKANEEFSVPHIGWNSLEVSSNNSSSLQKLSNLNGGRVSDFYFVHSFHCKTKDNSVISSFIREKNNHFAASLKFKNIEGFQFHPEKSGKIGYQLLDIALKSK